MANTIILRENLRDKIAMFRDQKFVVVPFFNREFEWELTKAGDTVLVEVFPDTAWTDKVIADAGETITLTDFAITTESFQVLKVAQIGQKIKNIEQVRSNLNLQNELAKRIGYNQAKLFDTYATSQAIAWVGAANILIPGTVLTAANIYNHFLLGSVALQEANIDPLTDTVAAFVEPKYSNLLKQANILDNTDAGLVARKAGYIGMLDGIRLYTTNSMIGKNLVLFMQDQSGHFVDQLNDIDIEKIPLAKAYGLTWEVVYDAKIMPSNALRLASVTYAAI